MNRPAMSNRRLFLTAGYAAIAAGTVTKAVTAAPNADAEIHAAIAECVRLDQASMLADQAAENANELFEELGGCPAWPDAMFHRDGDGDFDIRADTNEGGRLHVSFFHVEHLRQNPRRRAVIVRWEPIPLPYRGEHYVHRRVVDGVDEMGIRGWVPWPEAQARSDEIVAAYDERQAERKRRAEVSGLTAAEEAASEALSAAEDARARLSSLPATTVEGATAKARYIFASLYGSDLADISNEIGQDDLSDAMRLALSVVRDLVLVVGAQA